MRAAHAAGASPRSAVSCHRTSFKGSVARLPSFRGPVFFRPEESAFHHFDCKAQADDDHRSRLCDEVSPRKASPRAAKESRVASRLTPLRGYRLPSHQNPRADALGYALSPGSGLLTETSRRGALHELHHEPLGRETSLVHLFIMTVTYSVWSR